MSNDLQKLFSMGSCYIDNMLYTENNHRYVGTNRAENTRTLVVVVGCGGTGGRIIPLLSQHIANHNKTFSEQFNNNLYLKHKMQLVLIDGDVAEPKNLRRQNLITSDISRPKAEVLAERYSALYGLDIKYYNQKFDKKLFEGNSYIKNIIIFDCTDNLKARQSIEETCNFRFYDKKIIIISCGNESDFGQILISQNNEGFYGVNRTNKLIDEYKGISNFILEKNPKKKYGIKNIPTLLELFKDFKDTEKPSCVDATLIDDQSMPINSLVAQLAYNAFYNLVAGQNLNYHMVKCNINNTFSTNYISYPVDALNLIVKGLYGECTKEAIDVLDAGTAMSEYTDKEVIINFFNNFDRKYTEIFYNNLITSNYKMWKTDIARLNWRM